MPGRYQVCCKTREGKVVVAVCGVGVFGLGGGRREGAERERACVSVCES